ncbi:hypothetical protein OHV13_18595 [Kitasatospora purpeofusca]|uniref:hypothetical protein n=1 Tax=Kitasatospora purpeofusca TaxID=67352 RepID=UPI003246E2A2
MEVEGGDGRGGAGGAGGRFEDELVVRLGARAQGVGGSPPLAELRAAGRRRARRGTALRVAAGAAVLAVGVGALTQLGTGGGGGLPGPSGDGESESASVNSLYEVCPFGPGSLRLYTWEQQHSLAPTPPRTNTYPPELVSPRPGMTSSMEQANRNTRAVADAIRRFGAQRYPDHWFGACADQVTRTVYVMRAPGSDLDTVLPQSVPHAGVGIEFVKVVGSRRFFETLVARIEVEDAAYWAQRGVTISGVRISEDGAGVVVETEQATAARADIVARYGDLVIEVRPRY